MARSRSKGGRRLTAWMRTLRAAAQRVGRLRFGVVTLALLAVLWFVFQGVRSRPVPQPIAFNHLKHAGELGLACEFCHPFVTSGAHAGLPEGDTCAMCHRAIQGSSEEAARVTEIIQSGGAIRFNKLFAMPDHVFYTHRRHVGIAELPCAECHGSIAETTRPPRGPLVRITMDKCLDCHRETGQTLNCNACHR